MKIEQVASVLREYGEAIRGDWGSIDGRGERSTINEFADAFLKPESFTAERLRDMSDICPFGGGHWTEHCYDTCGEEE
jgi:hypothetical protein